MNDGPTKPETLSDDYIAEVLEGGEKEAEVKHGFTNGGTLYRDILSEASKRIRKYSNALHELLEQDACVQQGFDENNEYCRDCGGRPEEFGGSGTCPWEIARNALKHGKDI